MSGRADNREDLGWLDLPLIHGLPNSTACCGIDEPVRAKVRHLDSQRSMALMLPDFVMAGGFPPHRNSARIRRKH
jgi:hypothetical protein